MRTTALLFLAAILGCLIASAALADTGTYQILDYRVKLTPHSDGFVEITYDQKWQVTGGSIPWITVGVPGSGFLVPGGKTSGAVRTIRNGSEGNWTGVRIDLDKDYGPGQTFEVGFTILQSHLLYADADNYRLDFSPGWYDRARIDHLRIEVFFFAKIDTVTATPQPSQREGQSLIWEKRNLGQGERTNISVAFPQKLFPATVSLREKPSKPSKPSGDFVFPWFAFLVVILVAGMFVYLFIRASIGWGYSRGGHIFYGGGPHRRGGGGLLSGGGGGGGRIFSGGGGGFGGSSASCVCACACAGCACACACAGGSAAGCDRKTDLTCPLCRDCSAPGCPFRRR